MDDLAFQFLCACREAVVRQNDLLPELSRALGVSPTELYYTWMSQTIEQSGSFCGGEWDYVFHGLECDLSHCSDGRFLRVDFGPHGRTDTFSGWGILQFIMTSRAPRRSFPDLQEHLAEKPPPYHSWSGSHARMRSLMERLETAGFVQAADPELCACVERHTIIEPNGRRLLNFPEDLPERTVLDALVCYLWVLTPEAVKALEPY